MANTTLSTLGEYLRDMLVDAGLSNVYVGAIPALDVEGVGIQIYSGTTPSQFIGTTTTLFYVNVQIHFRGYSYPVVSSWCDTVKALLHRFRRDNILGSQLFGSTMYMGQTLEKLHEFQQTYQIILEE